MHPNGILVKKEKQTFAEMWIVRVWSLYFN